MQDQRVGMRYAQALFDTAVKYDVIKSVEDDLIAISSLIENDAEFRRFLLAPYTSHEEKVTIAEKLFSDRVTALTMQFLRVMLRKGRETDIDSVKDAYSELRRAHSGTMFVAVTSAVELLPAEKTALTAKLEQQFGKTVESSYSVEPSLIGGVKVAYESNVLDGSVKGTLSKLREQLRHDLLKQV